MRNWLIILLMMMGIGTFAQTPTDTLPGDPGGLYVFTTQNLSFGAFSHGNVGGTITIDPQGGRFSNGDIQLLNLGFQYFNAIFEVEAPAGAIITLSNGSNVNIPGSNGGTISLQVGTHSPTTPFVNNLSPPNRTQIKVGGTLTVGNAATSPPGTYSGNFYITFNQQ